MLKVKLSHIRPVEAISQLISRKPFIFALRRGSLSRVNIKFAVIWKLVERNLGSIKFITSFNLDQTFLGS